MSYKIHGSVILLVKRLDDELMKIFQNSDCHSADYIEKFHSNNCSDRKAKNYFKAKGRSDPLCIN